MAAGAVFASMSTPLQSMLQAVGRADIPVKLLAAALLLKDFSQLLAHRNPGAEHYGSGHWHPWPAIFS